jgi:serine/threonine protein kinase/Tol biopolymer transport system component
MMSSARRDPPGLDADTWRRIGVVLDGFRVSDLNKRPEVLVEACRAEGVRVEDVKPYLEAQEQSGEFPEQLDPAIFVDVLQILAGDAPSPTLKSGTRLGPYEILSLIGVGGMGEVYRARDTRLDRLVALKHLSAHVAASSEGRRRFEREAHATSVLNHPHICTLHDVGEHEGVAFLVMELAEGESLAARLTRGPLPIADAIQYGAQMAEALAAAHRQGIVHRDLKPANIMLTVHGVKLLDFGLAALRPQGVLMEGGHAEGLTAPGTILGTLQYMAPEQLQRRPVDARADIFSLGAILYEMLTGRCAFNADSSAGLVAAVLDRTPNPLSVDRPDTPAALDWTVAQCLNKLPGERWQNAADLAKQLRWLEASKPVADEQSSFRNTRRGKLARLVAGGALVAILVVGTSYVASQRQAANDGLAYRFAMLPPAGTSYEQLLTISPDGRRLAFSATDIAGQRSLWIRSLEGLTAQRVAGTEGALHPFWSPDSGSVGFFADLKLKIVELRTGNVRILSDSGSGGGGTWNADGVILFADQSLLSGRTSHAGLRRISADGGTAAAVARLEAGGPAIQAYPHFLPDGRHYLYMHMQPGTAEPGVYVGQLDSSESKRLLPAMVTVITPQQNAVHGPLRATYAAGHLFYLDHSDGTLVAQPFDTGRLELTGEAVRIAQTVESSAPGKSVYDVSPTGVLVYRPSVAPSGSPSQLVWFDRAGRETSRLGDPGPYRNAVLSRDGRHVLLDRLADGLDIGSIWRMDVKSGTSSRIVQGQLPVLSPDGKKLAYSAGPGRLAHITSLEGLKGDGILFSPPVESWAGDWSTDGRRIVGTALRPGTGHDVFATVVGSGNATYPIASGLDETDPRLSPDGRWLAYAAADHSKNWGVYVRAFDGPSATWLISPAGGRYPHWSADGRALFYVTADGTLMRTSVVPGPTFAVAGTTALFRRPELSVGFNDVSTARPYLVTPGDERILMPVPIETPAPAPAIVVTNWPALVRPSKP